MKSFKLFPIYLFLITLSAPASQNYFCKESNIDSLAKLVAHKKPWETIEANSEQRQPYYIGASPRDFVLNGKTADHPSLPRFALELVEKQSQILLKGLGLNEVDFEIWPYLTDLGDPNWVFARYRRDNRSPWLWLNRSDWQDGNLGANSTPALPILMNPHSPRESHLLFSDFLSFESLYQKPLYQEAIWTRKQAKEIIAGWISKEELPSFKKVLANDLSVRARILPQPARFNELAFTFIVHAQDKKPLGWGETKVNWTEVDLTEPKANTAFASFQFSADFRDKFLQDIRTLTGEDVARFPISKKQMRFTRKSAAQTHHQLLDVVSYLEERYHNLGLETRRQHFTWRGIPQENLVAIIHGSNPELPPILFADHFDTAFAEDHYAKTHERVTNPGADDNGTATASLLRAAEELKSKRPLRDIWFLHLTGEEFPGDDLGVRHFLKELLKDKKDIAGMILVDMIGIRNSEDPVYQINAGKTASSLALSQVAMQVGKASPSPYQPQFRHRFSDESYLYNTDGYIVDSLGFPVVFFNEHLNRHTLGKINFHYHQTTDLSQQLDLDYATHISQVAITTLWNAALR